MLNVLVVDDEECVRRLVRQVLERRGYTVGGVAVLEAANGREAWHMLLAGEVGIDVVLSDKDMPEMGGFALLDHLQEVGAEIGFVLMSGDETVSKADPTMLSLVCQDKEIPLLRKPFLAEDVMNAVVSVANYKR